jgi:hypothetical protein
MLSEEENQGDLRLREELTFFKAVPALNTGFTSDS